MVLLHTGALTEAIGHLETAARCDPGRPGTRSLLGEALLTAGRPTEAVTALVRACSLGPGSAAARDRLDEARRLVGAAAAAR